MYNVYTSTHVPTCPHRYIVIIQTPEWDEADSDIDDNDDILDLDGGDEAVETDTSWAGALLKTSLGGFLHGLTGTKVTTTSLPPRSSLRQGFQRLCTTLGSAYTLWERERRGAMSEILTGWVYSSSATYLVPGYAVC